MSDSIFLTDGNGTITGLVDTSYAGELIIPEYVGNERITAIGNGAFQDYTDLTSVIIPDSVTSIGLNAFNNSGLTSIIIPDSVTSIHWAAFRPCFSLASIVVDENNVVYDSRNNCNAIIETATNNLFIGCKNTIIPDSVTSIGEYSFSLCTGLTSIIIPNSVTSIGSDAFSGSNLTSVIIPDSVTSIGHHAFGGCSNLTSVIIPDSVTSIGDSSFSSTPWLTSKQQENPLVIVNGILIDGSTCSGDVVIPDGVTSISGSALSMIDITSVTIPNSVTNIEDGAFFYSPSLTTVYVPDPNNLSEAVASYNWTETGSSSITFKLDPNIDFLVKSGTLTNLADKIRILSGTEDSMTPATMDTKLGSANTEVDTQTELISQIQLIFDELLDIISFTITYNEFGAVMSYRAKENMTWVQWCDSDYNLREMFYIDTSSSKVRYRTASGEIIDVVATDVIKADYNYLFGRIPQ